MPVFPSRDHVVGHVCIHLDCTHIAEGLMFVVLLKYTASNWEHTIYMY